MTLVKSMNSKTITIFILLVAVFAIPRTTVHASFLANKKEQAFCATLPTTETKLWAKVHARSAERSTIVANHIKELQTKWNTIDTTIKKNRTDIDTKRARAFEDSYARATNPEQKEAVRVLQQAVATATATYRASVDSAIKTAQQSMQSLLDTEEPASELGQAINRARSACAIGRGDRDAKSEFTKDVSAVVHARINKKIPEALMAQITAIRTTREQSIKNAVTEYKKSLALAQDQFKKSFK